MIVVDVNVIAYLWIPGELTSYAENVVRYDADWAAPILWRSEFRNILAGYLRRSNIDVETLSLCLAQAEQQMRKCEFQVASAQVMEWVAQSRLSAYDCEYLALAAELDVPLVTADKAMLRAFPDLTRSIKTFE